MTSLDPAEFASVDPKQFAELVKAAPKAQLDSMMTGPDRKKILDEIFGRFPAQFRADRAAATVATIHWNIDGTDTYEVVIGDGGCTISPSPAGEATLTVTLAGIDFLLLVAGVANPMMMFMTGKLKAKGDLGLAANLANLFDLPKG